MSLGRFIWGIVIIFIGLVFLLTNFGFLSPAVWADLWRLWPIIIIVIGLSILSRSLSIAGQIALNILVVILIIGGLTFALFTNTESVTRFRERSVTSTAETSQISEELPAGTKPLSVIIKTGAANINIEKSTDKFVSGTIESNVGEISTTRSSTSREERLEISTSGLRGGFLFRAKNNWDLALNNQLPLTLEMETGAVDSELDLSDLNLQGLKIKSGASSFDITLGDKAEKLSGEINIGASSVKIRAPKAVGLKFIYQTGVSSNNFNNQGLTKSGETYTSENYDSATKKIDLTIKAGASSFELERF